MTWPRSFTPGRRLGRVALGVLTGIACLAGLPAVAAAAPQAGMRSHAAQQAPAAPAGTGATAPSTPTGGQPTGSGVVASAPDDTQQLGGKDPACHDPSGLSPQALRNCQASGSPASAFPVGNYQPDTNIDTGITEPQNDVQSMIQSIVGLVFGLLAKVTSIAILAVSLAFGFDLFGADHQQRVPHALLAAEHFFTLPWLPVAFAIGAIWGIARWWGQRQEGRAIGHWALMVAMMLLGLVIVNDPQGTAGWFDSFTNQAAMGSLAAFSGHDPTQPAGSYADATAAMWLQTVEEPWCAVEFGDTQWCMSPLDRQTQQWRADAVANLANAAAPDPNPAAEQQLERRRLMDAQTNGELWLAFPSGDDARNGKTDGWTLYHHLLQVRPDLAQIRGTGGVGERLGDLALCAVGMTFFLLVLIYIAVNLLLASVFFLLLLAVAPFMVLTPAFGEKGRGVFLLWLGYAGEALAKRLIYAIYLGVLLFASSFIGGIAAGLGGWLIQWIVLCILWGLAFTHRGKLLSLFSADGHTEHHRGLEAAAVGVGALAAARVAGRHAVARPARSAWDRGRDAIDERRYLRDHRRGDEEHRTRIEHDRAEGQNAEHRLQRRAVAMLDARYQHAQQTLARRPEILQEISTVRGEAERLRTRRLAQGTNIPAGDQERSAIERATELEGAVASAERFVHAGQEHERLTGRSYTPRQLADARQAVEQELGTHPDARDYEQLAYRVDGGRDAYRQADGEQRQLMRGQINRQIDEDRRALATSQRTPARLDPYPPVAPPRPRRRRPHPYRPYGEFIGSRQHLPPVPPHPQ